MSVSGQEALPDVQGYLPDIREWSEDNQGLAGVVGRPSWMYGSSRLALPDVRGNPVHVVRRLPIVREAIADVRKWSGGPSGCPAVVGSLYRMSVRPSRIFESGQETLPDVRGLVGSPTRMSGCAWKTLPDYWEWSGGSLGCAVVVGRPS